MNKIKNLRPFAISGTVDNATGLTLLPQHSNAGFIPIIESFTVTVTGSTGWADAATLTLKDTEGNVFATIAQAALAGDAVIFPHTADVTLGAAWNDGGSAAAGIVIEPDAEETTGDPVTIRITGHLAPA
jgi:hypothetical protein